MAIGQKTGGYPFKTNYKPGALAPQLSAEELNAIGRFLNALVESRDQAASYSGARVDIGNLPSARGATAGQRATLVNDGEKLVVKWL